MSENKRDYAVGHGKPPVRRRFKESQSSNRADRAGRPGLTPDDCAQSRLWVKVSSEQGENTIRRRKAVV